ncbi:2-oxo acid dehydrogenase subunit E2 [Desulfogranum mediterraneum]|uniref:2-oxo acid dehydrogenase subunit E2 n=1 Tax=Desulfogranum mediterraneum TaxID=160661 RepID=UPI00041245FA|nr:2-oxo acid dehydrogenase subunit E2 [Desulfogranum mediterraneum]
MNSIPITIPDFGDVQEITVIEIFIRPGQRVEQEEALISLESEKAVMDIPAPLSGTIEEVLLREGQQVKSGQLIALLTAERQEDRPDTPPEQTAAPAEAPEPTEPAAPGGAAPRPGPPPKAQEPGAPVHATPSVRAYARKLGIDLSLVQASGPKGRLLKEDLELLLRQAIRRHQEDGNRAAPAGAALAAMDGKEYGEEEYALYGEISQLPLGRIQKISGERLHTSWLNIPHVTHFEQADISELEEFRQQLNRENEGKEPRLSLLVFVLKAVAATLAHFPLVNSSLAAGDRVILKHHYHLGVAVDTPQGLLVPVIRDVERKGVLEINRELRELSQAAREGRLQPGEMEGGSFTISSLGKLGGTNFTPIINAPQAAILGLAKSSIQPVWDGSAFTPRLILPFSLSYDHRIIDGAEAARFCAALAAAVMDLKRTLL